MEDSVEFYCLCIAVLALKNHRRSLSKSREALPFKSLVLYIAYFSALKYVAQKEEQTCLSYSLTGLKLSRVSVDFELSQQKISPQACTHFYLCI